MNTSVPLYLLNTPLLVHSPYCGRNWCIKTLFTTLRIFLQDRKLLLIFKHSLWTQDGKGWVTRRGDQCIYMGYLHTVWLWGYFLFCWLLEPLFCLMKHLRMAGKSNAMGERGWNCSKANVAVSCILSSSCCCWKRREFLPCHVLVL